MNFRLLEKLLVPELDDIKKESSSDVSQYTVGGSFRRSTEGRVSPLAWLIRYRALPEETSYDGMYNVGT